MRATTIALAAGWWAAVALARHQPHDIRAGLATVSAGVGSLLAVEWAWDSRTLTVAVLVGVAALAAAAAWRAVEAAVSAACVGVSAGAAVTAVGLWVDGTGGRTTTTGVAVAVAAAALLAARPWLPGARATVAASVAAAAAVLGSALSVSSPLALALAWTVLTAGLLASGTGQHADRWRLGALCLSVPAAWAWLAASDVTVLEAWALPLGAALLAAGWWAVRPVRRGDRHPSWLVWGPGLSVLLLPTAALVALGPQPPFWRLAYLAVVATAALLLGAGRRSQAPAVLGLLGLMALASPVVGPWLAATPLWVLLTLAGAVLVWVGFTWEHRIAGARHARDVFAHFS